MNRRGFLASLAAAAFALDPERALWVPGKKLISVPAALAADYPVYRFHEWFKFAPDGSVYRSVDNGHTWVPCSYVRGVPWPPLRFETNAFAFVSPRA